MSRLRIAAACILIAACSIPPSAFARALIMAVAAEPSSMDPLFSRTQSNQQVENIFEHLIARDVNLPVIRPCPYRLLFRARGRDGEDRSIDLRAILVLRDRPTGIA